MDLVRAPQKLVELLDTATGPESTRGNEATYTTVVNDERFAGCFDLLTSFFETESKTMDIEVSQPPINHPQDPSTWLPCTTTACDSVLIPLRPLARPCRMQPCRADCCHTPGSPVQGISACEHEYNTTGWNSDPCCNDALRLGDCCVPSTRTMTIDGLFRGAKSAAIASTCGDKASAVEALVNKKAFAEVLRAAQDPETGCDAAARGISQNDPTVWPRLINPIVRTPNHHDLHLAPAPLA